MIKQEIIDRTYHTKTGEQAYKVCETLLDAGFEAWWVGGAVRDMLLGEIPEDIDIATSAKPEEVTKLFEKFDDHRAELGAVVVSLSGQIFEVTTYRKDAPTTKGREPESVEFTDRAGDAARRDITINAIYWNPISSEVFDPFDGAHDLTEKLVRIIGDPTTRIEQDALRLLRVIRFRALINGQYHPETFQALHAKAQDIELLSGSRRFEELEKMLLGPYPEVAFEDLWETDIIEHLLPELHKCKGVAQPIPPHHEGDVWAHTMQCISSFTADHGADTRWATLFHDIGKPETFKFEGERITFNEHAPAAGRIVREVFKRLQCPNKRTEKIAWLCEHHMMMGTFLQELSVDRRAHWYYHPWFIELLQLFYLDVAGTTPNRFEMYEEIISDYNKFLDEHPRPPKALLKGDEVMEILGLEPGPKVGEIMKQLYDAQVKKKITTKKEAIAYLTDFTK